MNLKFVDVNVKIEMAIYKLYNHAGSAPFMLENGNVDVVSSTYMKLKSPCTWFTSSVTSKSITYVLFSSFCMLQMLMIDMTINDKSMMYCAIKQNV